MRVHRRDTRARECAIETIDRPSKVALAVVGAVGVLLLWSRLVRLDVGFWHDEAYTVMTFVNRGPVTMLFGYYTPNNHVLFSLLSWATAWRLGHFEAAFRTWSVVPGIAAVAVAGWWAWRRLGPAVGAAVVVLATLSPVHLDLTPQARGYGLGFLAGAGMLVGAVRAGDRGRVRDFAVLAAFAVVGIWTLPQMVLPFVAHAGVLLVVRRELRRATVVTVAVVGTASLLFYAPLLDQMAKSTQTDFGPGPLPWNGWLTGPFRDLARPTLAILLPDALATGPVVAAVCAVLVVLGCRRLWRRGDRALLSQLLVPLVGTYVALVVARFWFSPRFASFLLFYVIALLAVGVVELWSLVRPYLALRGLVAAAAVAAVVVGSLHVVERTELLPKENFKFVGQLVRGSGIDEVVTNSRAPVGLQYYLGRKRLKVLPAPVLSDLFCTAPGPLVFVDHNGFLSPDPDFSCLNRRGAARIQVSQPERGSMDVWILGG